MRWFARGILVSTFCLNAGCGPTSAPEVEEPTLARMSSIARHDRVIERRLSSVSTASFTVLDVATGANAGDPWLLSARGVDGATLRLTPRDHAASPRVLTGERSTYRDVATSTDAAYVHDGSGAELLYLLRDARAPRKFSFDVERGSALASVRDDGAGGLSFRDARGTERLFIEAPYAIDARGTRRNARLFFHADRLEIELDTRDLEFPVLLDPYIGTARWRLLTVNPGARYAASMAARGSSLLLYGGHGSVVLGDTWSWDGSRWTELHPAKSPSPREGAAIATLGSSTILFGGVDASLTKALDETWSFDGTNWTQLAPMHHPPALVYGTLLHAGGKLVLVGGKKPGGSTWVFDGTDWIENTSTPSPSFVFDGRAGVFADDGTTAFYTGGGETWTFDGTTWTDHTATAGTPSFVAGVGRVGGKMVLIGGGSTYEWSGTAWVLRGPITDTIPDSLRYANQYAITSLGDGIAIYGGLSLAGALLDFVRFDTTGWNVPVNRGVPPGRGFASLATLGDRAVLFGGWNGEPLGDTWELDGTAWTEKKPSTSPPARYEAAFADAGDVALLFGGFSPDASNDTWLWNHTTWTRATPSTSPPGGGAKLARVGSNDVLLAGSKAYVWNAGNWAPQTGKAPDRVGKIVTGGDFSVFTSYAGQGILIVPELGTVWSYGPSGFQSIKADNLEAIGGATAVRPLLGDAGIDLGRYALLLGHRLGAIETESWLWDGKGFAQLASSGLPPLAQPAATRLGSDVVLFGGFDSASKPSSDTYLMRVALANGIACTADADCESAHCAQGVCCNTACTGATEACNQPATMGTCAPILAACTGPSTLQSADGTQKSCLPYLCVAGACLQKCTSSDECAAGTICDTSSSQCVPPAPAESSGGCALESAKPRDLSVFIGALFALAVLRRRR